MQELETGFGKIKVYSKFGSEYLPARSTRGAAGFDLKAPEDYFLPPGKRTVIDTGLVIDGSDLKVPFMMMIVPRCSTGVFDEITVTNTAAIIDMDYKGPEDNIYVFLGRRNTEDVVNTPLSRKMFKLEQYLKNVLDVDISIFSKDNSSYPLVLKHLTKKAKETFERNLSLPFFKSNIKTKLENDTIKKGMAYAQIIFVPVMFPEVEEISIDQLTDLSRGGMGSTGK